MFKNKNTETILSPSNLTKAGEHTYLHLQAWDPLHQNHEGHFYFKIPKLHPIVSDSEETSNRILTLQMISVELVSNHT